MTSGTTTSSKPAAAAVAATPDETRDSFVRRTRRGYTSVRHVFVQNHSGPVRASTLARFCRNRKKRALVLYLLLLTVWEPGGSPLRSEVWLRGLTVAGGNVTWSKSSLSTAWSSLVDMGMATRTRTRRMADLTPMREDGEAAYTHPDGKKIIDRYFALPGAFWTDRWFDKLSLPAICVLLVLLKETNDKDEVHLTHREFDSWYGISASSAKKGIGELVKEGLVDVREEPLKAPLATDGFTLHYYYKLTGAFSTASRKAARAEASSAALKRATKAGAAARYTGRKAATKAASSKTIGTKVGKSRAAKKQGAKKAAIKKRHKAEGD